MIYKHKKRRKTQRPDFVSTQKKKKIKDKVVKREVNTDQTSTHVSNLTMKVKLKTGSELDRSDTKQKSGLEKTTLVTEDLGWSWYK